MKHKDIKGVTLIELMITLVVFSIIFGMVYSVYNTFLKQATIERATEKTELDVVANFWSFLKDIEAAGYGTPKTGPCGQAITFSNNELIIHSTAIGADKYAGRYGYVKGNDCTVSDMADIASGENVAIISGTDRSLIGFSQINAGKLTPCNDAYKDKIAYWIPDTSMGCYEVRYGIHSYNRNEPAMCKNTGAMVLRKSLSRTAQPNWEPLLDCVFGTDGDGDRGLNFRFGCIDSKGNLTWRVDTNCAPATLRLVKIGLVIQASPRKDTEGPASITLFEDLDPSLRVTINLNNEQRFYRWRVLEQTIILRNPA